MATEVHEGANGKPKVKEQVEPLGELKPTITTNSNNREEELKKPVADLSSTAAGDVNGCETLALKDEPLAKISLLNKHKGVVQDGLDVEDGNEPQDANDYSSNDEEGDEDGDGEEDAREVDGEPDDEEDDEEEYVDDGEEDEGDDDEESQPPNKRRK